MGSRFLSILTSLLLVSSVSAQNLVPNPSFEEYENGCPENFHDIPVGWEWWRNSPNAFSTCVEPETLIDSLGWAPWNGFGYQEPFEGNSYVGMYTCSPLDWSLSEKSDFREYIGCQLIDALQIGQEYFVTFQVSAAFGNYFYPSWATSHIGIYFTNSSYDWLEYPLEIPNESQVYSEEILSDTISWVEISGSFIADQNYTHMGIGVFFEFEYTDTLDLVEGVFSTLGGYVYVDDVCVKKQGTECSIPGKIEERRSELELFPNPASDFVNIKLNANSFTGKYRIDVFRTDGTLEDQLMVQDLENIMLDLSDYESGVYFFHCEEALMRKKLVVVR